MSSKTTGQSSWQEELKRLPMDQAKLQASAQALNAEEIIKEVDKIPERYPTPVEKPANTNKKRKTRQKWTTPDEIAAAMTYRLVEKEHGRYQNIQEDRKQLIRAFAGKQRFVRSVWPQYENVPAYKPPTHEALAQKITKTCKEYEPFFKDPENKHIAKCLDGIKIHPLLVLKSSKKQPLQNRNFEPPRQEELYSR